MASSAIKSEDEKLEFFDTEEELEKKISKLAEYVRKSKCFIGFTGAGISTSCGIPDFRSGYNTVLQTGPGAWEVLSEKKPLRQRKVVEITQAIPSKTHMGFLALINENIMKHLVSQNVDGLHRKSGVKAESISELHGNIYIEKCAACKKEYLRDHDVVTSDCATNHLTGSNCDNPECGGKLVDNIINFGENLDQKVINLAFSFAEKADLCLAMGSSLRVTPAANIPKIVGKKQRLVIVNLQKTPLDHYAKFVIHSFCDTVIERLMRKLDLPIPDFVLKRYLRIIRNTDSVVLEGVDEDGSLFSFLKSVRFYSGDRSGRVRSHPFVWNFNGDVEVKIRFQGHYGEPPVRLRIPSRLSVEYLKLEYSPVSGNWSIQSHYI